MDDCSLGRGILDPGGEWWGHSVILEVNDRGLKEIIVESSGHQQKEIDDVGIFDEYKI